MGLETKENHLRRRGREKVKNYWAKLWTRQARTTFSNYCITITD